MRHIFADLLGKTTFVEQSEVNYQSGVVAAWAFEGACVVAHIPPLNFRLFIFFNEPVFVFNLIFTGVFRVVTGLRPRYVMPDLHRNFSSEPNKKKS